METKNVWEKTYKVKDMGSLLNSITSVDGVLMVKLESLRGPILEDIKSYCEENKRTILLTRYDGYMNLETALNFYLEWNGIIGYTDLIMEIIQQASICRIQLD
jgi:hypothetical protein